MLIELNIKLDICIASLIGRRNLVETGTQELTVETGGQYDEQEFKMREKCRLEDD